MDVSIGADVIGTDGKLGEVQGFIVDARSEHVTELVVKHGGLFGGNSRLVPLANVTSTEGGSVRVDLDKQHFEILNGYTEGGVRGPDPDYVGPPDADLQGTYQGNFEFRTTWAAGSAGGLGAVGKPLGYPGGEQLTPDFAQRPAVTAGTPVLSSDGEKVGEVGEFAATSDTGTPQRLSMKTGFLFKKETELPVDWIKAVTADGIMLHVEKSEVEALAQRD